MLFALALKVNSYIHMIKNNNIYFIFTDIITNLKFINPGAEIVISDKSIFIFRLCLR